MKENIQYLSFWIGVTLLNVIFSGAIHFPTNFIWFYLSQIEIVLGLCAIFSLSIHLLMDIYAGPISLMLWIEQQ